MNYIRKHKILSFCYLLIYITFIINVIVNLKSSYLWNDESFTFHMIHHSFFNIVNLTAKDVHPFLYYFISKICITPFKAKLLQIDVLRIVSAVPYLILLIIGNHNIKRLFGTITSLLFMMSIISMPLLVNNMYQIRMYGWATVFTTITFLCFIYIFKKRIHNSMKSFVMISFFALLAAYTHYYALITVALMYFMFMIAFLIDHKRIRYLLLSVLIDIVFYLPWINVLLRQTKSVSRNYWTPLINHQYIISTVNSLFIANSNSRIYQFLMHGKIFLLLEIIALAFVAFLFIKYLKWNVDSEIILMGLALPFALMLVGLGLSMIIGHNVLILRYLTPAMGAFWLSIAMLIGKLCRVKSGRIIGIVLFLAVLILGLKSYRFNFSQVKTNGQQFNQTLKVFKRIPKRADVIYNESTVMYSSSSYLKHNYVLGNRKNDVLFKVYHKVFDNIQNNHRLSVSRHRPVYFIKLKHENKNDIYLSRKTNDFAKKYGHHMSRVGEIYLPLDGGESVVYRIRK